jgi:hypothetical protein
VSVKSFCYGSLFVCQYECAWLWSFSQVGRCKLSYLQTLFSNSAAILSLDSFLKQPAQIDKAPTVRTKRPKMRERNTCLVPLRLSLGWRCATRTDLGIAADELAAMGGVARATGGPAKGRRNPSASRLLCFYPWREGHDGSKRSVSRT